MGRSHEHRRKWGVAAIVLLGALTLASCGGSSATAALPTDTPLATMTTTSLPSPTSVPTITTTPGAQVNCATDLQFASAAHRIGDLLVTQVRLFNLAYPGRKVADNTPLKPLYVGATYNGNLVATDPLTNPNDAYDFSVCNTSATQAHTLSSVSAQIASLTPYSGQLNEWTACKGAYSRSGPIPGGCGGGDPRDETLQAAFVAGAQAGASATMSQENWNPYHIFGFEPARMGPLPLALAPGNGLVLSVDVSTPSASGTYAFSFGISVDGAPAAPIGTGEQVLLAPVAHTWTGNACTTAAMQAQIPPATTPPSYFICPES
jgi:hypothetical protein